MTSLGFLAIGGMGLLLLVGGIMFGFLGGDGDVGVGSVDVDVDAGTDLDGDAPDSGAAAGVSLLSVAGLGSALFGFGLFGYLGARLASPVLIGVPVGLVGAYITLRLTGYIRALLLRRLETGRSARQSEFAAKVATVTIPIPPGDSGSGQVRLVLHGNPVYASARTHEDREICNGAQVVVMDQVQGVCYVERLEEEGVR